MNTEEKLLDELFGKTEKTNTTEIVKMPMSSIVPNFKNPYKCREEDMKPLEESIRENGIIQPLMVRKDDKADVYEIISGHRRYLAASRLEMTEVPVVVLDISKEEADIILVDSNLHREHILPSEKAFGYKMKMDALKKQGKRTDLTSDQVGPKLSANEVSDTDSASQVKRYMAYWQSKGLGRGGKKTQPNPYKWCKTTIQKILEQQEYCGDVINFKTYSKNFKNKTRMQNPEENWKIFKDVHEPIIDRETFEMVQKLKAKAKRRAPKKENAEKHIFSGLMRCADCGSNMRYHTNAKNKEIHFFSCGNYVKDTRGTCQQRHYVRADSVEQIVMLELRKLAILLKNNENALAEILEKKTNKDIEAERKHIEAELQKSVTRQQTVASLYEKLYEDNAMGKVTDEWFMQLSHKYEVERVELKAKIAEYRTRLSSMDNTQKGKETFLSSVRRFLEMETLTAPLVRELIDHIDVYETEGTGKNRTQRIAIHYRFVGYLEIDKNYDSEIVTNEIRQGVAISYIPRALPEKITA